MISGIIIISVVMVLWFPFNKKNLLSFYTNYLWMISQGGESGHMDEWVGNDGSYIMGMQWCIMLFCLLYVSVIWKNSVGWVCSSLIQQWRHLRGIFIWSCVCVTQKRVFWVWMPTLVWRRGALWSSYWNTLLQGKPQFTEALWHPAEGCRALRKLSFGS